MVLVFGLMLLLQTAACLDRLCWFNQSDPCYAALGHKLTLRDAIQYEVKIQKNIDNKSTDPVCRVKNDTKKDCDLYSNRPEVEVINGTLIINPVIREDSGNYNVTFYHSHGGSETSTYLQVNVEAPIGSVNVLISCSSGGATRASCSSDGDQILYSWTLNGGPQMDGDSSIVLDNVTDGNINCSVKNHVSHGQKTVRVKPCPGTSPGGSRVTLDSEYVLVSLIALGCVALILILVFITVYHIYKKKQVKSTPAAAAAGSVDIIYADISHTKKREMKKPESLMAADVEYVEIQPQKKRKVRKEKEDEVQYGEVTFTNNRSSAHPRPQEECIYSQGAVISCQTLAKGTCHFFSEPQTVTSQFFSGQKRYHYDTKI